MLIERPVKSLFVLSCFAAAASAGEVKLGKPLALKEPVPIQSLLSEPEKYVGKAVQVKGKVTEVCRKMGCWMQLVDAGSGKGIRIKVNDGEIVFPKEAIGKIAVAEGTFSKLELTREQAQARARHEAEEKGVPFDPESVQGGMAIYQIQGAGAVLID